MRTPRRVHVRAEGAERVLLVRTVLARGRDGRFRRAPCCPGKTSPTDGPSQTRADGHAGCAGGLPVRPRRLGHRRRSPIIAAPSATSTSSSARSASTPRRRVARKRPPDHQLRLPLQGVLQRHVGDDRARSSLARRHSQSRQGRLSLLGRHYDRSFPQRGRAPDAVRLHPLRNHRAQTCSKRHWNEP